RDRKRKEEAWQDFDVVRNAAITPGPVPDLGVILPCTGQPPAAWRKNHLGGFGGKLAAGVRGAGLDNDRPALDWARDVQRPTHRQELALMVEHVHAVGIEINAFLDITDKSVLGKTVPQTGHDVEELAGAAIALAVFHVLGQPEIQRRIRIGGGDQVPAGAAAADMVE